jgi:hypothetical protein
MTSFNIVDLITNNPITKLNETHNNNLLNKVKNTFNESQQQLFIASFYSYLNYHKTDDYIVDLDSIWKWLGFNRKYNATICLEKNFILNKDYSKKYSISNNNIFATADAVAKTKGSGGHNSEKYYLNVKTFKSFCLKAGTKKADEIHEYYLKMEELIQEVLEEEATEMKNKLLIKQSELEQLEENKKKELEKLEENKKKEYEEKLIKEKALERQKILLKEFGNSESLIYIIKVKSYNNGEYVIKLGESRRGILGRFNEHKSHYEECLLLDCFFLDKSKDFESFLHNHESIRCNRVTDLAKHKNERELFLIGKELSYKMLLKIIDNNIKYFEKNNNDEVEKLKLECEKLTLLNELNKNGNINSFIEELIKNNNTNNEILLNKIDNLEKINKTILEKLNLKQVKNTTNFNQPLVTLGPRLQQINPDSLSLIKVYDSVSECMRENYQIKRPSINKAIAENTIYHGYRWLYVDRELDPNIINNIQPTKKTKIQNLGYIAKLDKDKTQIINVYLDRKTASLANNFSSSSALDNHVKNNTLINEYYYILLSDCNLKLKSDFLNKHNLREICLYKNGIGQYNSEQELIQEFICKYDCIKKLHISDKTLRKALTRNIAYNNNYFKTIGSKLQI